MEREGEGKAGSNPPYQAGQQGLEARVRLGRHVTLLEGLIVCALGQQVQHGVGDVRVLVDDEGEEALDQAQFQQHGKQMRRPREEGGEVLELLIQLLLGFQEAHRVPGKLGPQLHVPGDGALE
jgi:hypothetical protein